jgi:hypothetical protein
VTMECISAGGWFHRDGAIMIVNELLGILTEGTRVALATNLFEGDAAGVLGPGSLHGMLILLGLGLSGLGIWGLKKIRQRNTYRRSLPDLGRKKGEFSFDLFLLRTNGYVKDKAEQEYKDFIGRYKGK